MKMIKEKDFCRIKILSKNRLFQKKKEDFYLRPNLCVKNQIPCSYNLQGKVLTETDKSISTGSIKFFDN
jgi:hypothetical protein